MAIQQMGLMAYKAPPGGGGDSAFLKQSFFTGGNVSIIQTEITFNPNLSRGDVGYNCDIPEQYTWKTGPNDWSNYVAKFIKTANNGPNDISGSAVNTFVNMSDNAPAWSVTPSDPTSSVTGYLVIAHSGNQGVELANVQLTLACNPNV